jgi:hypothetical protein
MLAEILLDPTGPVNVLLFIIGFVVFVGFVASIIWYPRKPENYHWANILMPIMLGTLAVLLGIVVPIQRTTAGVHGRQARSNLSVEYGAKVIKVDLMNHQAVLQPKGCPTPIQHEMRRIDGTYWLSFGIMAKDERGDLYVTRNMPIPRQDITDLCVKQSADIPAGTVIAMGNAH